MSRGRLLLVIALAAGAFAGALALGNSSRGSEQRQVGSAASSVARGSARPATRLLGTAAAVPSLSVPPPKAPPAPPPAPKPQETKPAPAPLPAPAPVVQAPTPQPAPAPKPTPRKPPAGSGGGFDDSG
jgi:outer membrane biosynthesis protein TonB